MANYPTFNPNAYGESTGESRRNRAIQDLYEPGSTFKIVTAGAALEEKLLTPDSPIETSPGTIRFGSRVIGEDKHHNYGSLTFTGVIVKSSNVGAVKIGLRVGAERLSDYVKRFGFGRTTSPDFRGENTGIVWPAAKLNDSALASMSMGHQVGVTPLQMASAVSVVANGGELLRPRVVRAVIRDGQRMPVPRKVVNRAISEETAAELTGIMEKVVTDGTGKPAQIAGFTVAGKTGTAQKVVNRRYSNSDYMVSFVGFVPSRNPLFTIVVVVDSPHKVPAYGSVVAAPIFQRIATAALRQYGVPPSLNAPPAVLVARHDERPEQPTSGPVELLTPSTRDGQDASADLSHVPDVRGLSARDALRVLARLGIPVRMQGTGFVLNQQPAPGTPLEPGLSSVLYLGRQPAVRLVSVTRP
jgi:cell division protein FtsI/penicillin-binding protein 2